MEKPQPRPIVDQLEEHVITISLIVMTVLVFLNVISRYVFHWSLAFTFELVTMLFLWSTMLGSAAAFLLGEHMSMGLADTLFPSVAKRALRLLSYLGAVAVFSLLLVYGWQMVQFQLKVGQITPNLGWPEAMVSMAIPVGSVLVIIRVLQTAYRDLLSRSRV